MDLETEIATDELEKDHRLVTSSSYDEHGNEIYWLRVFDGTGKKVLERKAKNEGERDGFRSEILGQYGKE